MRTSTFIVAAALCVASGVQGSVLQYDLDKSYTSSTHPAGLPAWLRIVADDGGANGNVTLKIQSLTLTGNEFVSKVLLNVRAPIAPSSLSASSLTKTGTFADPTVSFGNNAFSAGGGSSFDVLVSFATGGPENRFGSGDAVTMNISGSSLLNAQTFNTFSSGGSGLLFVSAHVQGIGSGDNSAWITALAPTPEPVGMLALIAGGCVLGRRR